jgi:RNA polymerase sigma-70 factor (ECF subfamily)
MSYAFPSQRVPGKRPAPSQSINTSSNREPSLPTRIGQWTTVVRSARARQPGNLSMPDDMVHLDIESLYRDHSAMVYRRIRKFFDEEQAEEVLHEIFVRVLGKGNSWRGESSITTWLYQVTTRHCLNRIRDTKRRAQLIDQHGFPGWAQGISPARQESAIFLQQLWEQLDEEHALIGVYHFLDGLSHDEIGRILGVSRRTIGNRLEAIRHMAERLSDNSSGDKR